MTVHTGAGVTIGLSATAPATYNAAGYEAVVLTDIGEISDFGEIPDRIYEIITWRRAGARGESKYKGGYALGSQTLTVGIDPEDAGQALLDVAKNSDALYTVGIKHPMLGAIYARALVTAGPKNYGDVNTPGTRQITLEYTVVSETEDGLVVVAPD